jgi:hypothetical protein
MTDIYDARKEPMSEQQVWDLLKTYETVVIAKGKSCVEYQPSDTTRGTILAEAMGRSGNLRAPSLAMGKKMFIGYNEALYDRYFT